MKLCSAALILVLAINGMFWPAENSAIAAEHNQDHEQFDTSMHATLYEFKTPEIPSQNPDEPGNESLQIVVGQSFDELGEAQVREVFKDEIFDPSGAKVHVTAIHSEPGLNNDEPHSGQEEDLAKDINELCPQCEHVAATYQNFEAPPAPQAPQTETAPANHRIAKNMYVGVRTVVMGVITGIIFYHFKNVDALAAMATGAMVGSLSGTMQAMSRKYYSWLINDEDPFGKKLNDASMKVTKRPVPSVIIQMAKGYVLEFPFVGLPRLLLATFGYHPHTSHALFTAAIMLGDIALSAIISPLTQGPLDTIISYKQHLFEKSATYLSDPKKWEPVVFHRVNAAAMAISFTTSGILAFAQLMHVPFLQWGGWILAGPSWLYYWHVRGNPQVLKAEQKVKEAFNRLKNSKLSVAATNALKKFAQDSKKNSEEFIRKESCKSILGLM